MRLRQAIAPVGLLVLAAAALALPLLLQPRGGGEVTTASTGPPKPFAFTPPRHVDPLRNASEPGVLVDADGRIFASGPLDVADGFQGRLWRSVDNGTTWQLVHEASGKRAEPGIGSGASGVAATKGGRIYYADLWLGDINVARSDDGGLTWTQAAPAARGVPGADRPWLGVYGENVVYLVYDQASGPTVSRSLDGGVTWVTRPIVDPAAGERPWTLGNVQVDPRDGSLYVPFTRTSAAGTGADVWCARSFDGGQTWDAVKVHAGEGSSSNLLATSAMDSAGNLYVAWSEKVGGRYKVFVSHSTDKGARWSAPARVGAGTGNSVFPWIVAGSPGRVGVTFYGTKYSGASDFAPMNVSWFPYYAESLDALSSASTWTYAPATGTPSHYGSICVQGIGCDAAAPKGDRTLGDLYQMALMPDGRVVIVYGDNHDACKAGSCGDASVTFIRQSAGDPLYS